MVQSSCLAYAEVEKQKVDERIRTHATLVKRIAHHMMGRLPDTVQLNDLIQAGMIGLLEAARKYDGEKGASFETYAGIRIRGAMVDEIRRGDWAPRSVHRNSRRISEAIQQIENEKGRDAEDAEVAERLGMSPDEYHGVLKDSATCRLFSFEEVLENNDQGLDSFLSEDDNPSSSIERQHFQQQLADAIRSLPEREQLVLSLYYDEELNLKEIGAVLGVSESRVCQIHSQAAHRLRARLGGWQD
ncbi:RNA polymerase sigma factor FliA [Parathalassolituus penaei]|uniref:RNA polymerase sigma factor FliA n=1 Tax=Parathalassolituus penaei TaxID=2997323 RepID=A0A9X3ITF0_9GAMM|nr:RNA polymerase sigma factor FliA [Parathalassolituus penaei]MCY0965123.1 RNA polymerase sigma factor FliA [Parathalassolituus penaei]